MSVSAQPPRVSPDTPARTLLTLPEASRALEAALRGVGARCAAMTSEPVLNVWTVTPDERHAAPHFKDRVSTPSTVDVWMTAARPGGVQPVNVAIVDLVTQDGDGFRLKTAGELSAEVSQKVGVYAQRRNTLAMHCNPDD